MECVFLTLYKIPKILHIVFTKSINTKLFDQKKISNNWSKDFVRFEDLFNLREQKTGLVVTFLAILELMKELLIEVVQAQEYGFIHVKMLVEKEIHEPN